MARVQDQDQALLRAAVAGALRAEVARAGLTQEEVASRTGLHRVTVNRLLTGERSIHADLLLTFAAALEFDAGDLLDAAQREYRKQRARSDAKDK
jgi:transcriptional regulator with XRE-family HTH domain